MSEELHPLPGWPTVRQTADGEDPPGVVTCPTIALSVSTMERTGKTLHTQATDLLTELWGWGGSFGVHCLILLIAALTIYSVDVRPEPPQISSLFSDSDEPVLPEMAQQKDIWNTNLDVPVVFTPARTVAEAVPEVNAHSDLLDELAPEETADAEPALSEPPDEEELIEPVAGIEGIVVNDLGDVGSVDQISLEIVKRLQKHKVIVVWLMDASASLRMRRQRVIGRFERIYRELDELAENRQDALLTSVVAFGEKTTPMFAEPTADRETIKRAVKEIAVDESGVENVFSAIKVAAFSHHKYAIKGYRVMIVVLTDEGGNDPAQLDAAIRQVKGDKMPVYVIGPLAPFAQREVNVKWTDSETSAAYFLPVERGPESAAFEYPELPHWDVGAKNVVLSSGFGSYGLVRIVRESGGIYFLHNDGSVPGPAFDDAGMLSYVPEYASAAELQRRIARQPLRQAVLSVASASRQRPVPQPPTKFLAAGIQFAIRDSERALSKTHEFLDGAVQQLQVVESFRKNEQSQRWQAHYDLLLGQLLLRRALLTRSIPLLGEMYSQPKACSDVASNAWELAGVASTPLSEVKFPAAEPGKAEPADESLEKENWRRKGRVRPSKEEFVQQDLRAAREHLERVVARHPGTPWAFLAAADLALPVEFEWKETFIIPPEGEKLPWDKPPGEWNELSEEDKAKLNEAKKRFERFRRERQKKKEQLEETEKKLAGKKRKLPKL